MKKIWKWILGIVIAVLIIGALTAIPWAMHSYFAPAYAARTFGADGNYGPGMMQKLQYEGPNGPFYAHPGGMMGRGQFQEIGPGTCPYGGTTNRFEGGELDCPYHEQGGYYRGGMMGRSVGFSSPMMYGFGFFPFGMFMWIIPLTLLGFAIYGIYALFTRRKTSPAPVESVAFQPCSNCGKSVQGDWKNCPYCGTNL